MSFHVEFRDYLEGLPDGARLIEAYNSYKQADAMFAYRLNGCLKGGLAPPAEILAHVLYLRRIICAQNTAPLTVYRMTSDTEFVGPLLPAIRGEPFRYLAFLSTSRQNNNLGIFVPNSGNPLVLEIRCPIGTAMALMEAEGGLEDEYLFGAGTRFRVVGHDEIQDPQEILALTGEDPEGKQMFRLILEVDANPAYTNGYEFFDFNPDDPAGEAPEGLP
jgi:hypothetical protein